MKWLLRSNVFQGSIVFQEPHLCIGLCAVQALQGKVCSVWPESHPLPEHLRRPHHPTPTLSSRPTTPSRSIWRPTRSWTSSSCICHFIDFIKLYT
ncbi:hypothetical protein ZEAMMB73_Zm00001d019111 [Zea mays]|uniref:Uncharacterized protein n=1 Tax=Zea mays TaxID=4577 RepID=A0A1D6HVG4_MAIZE|nr:hypothetical protein ZEAMMB73_Zm00001d019111 [Zea mays]ONM52239.1 hypothetical protein ZEAMMB73_Zm00001d019111 [Zea mays]ONM52240.1 hypothetical protein ZEAMMB73_Zm00001d019111 [Zea mays]ONM52244.1 hypothetical protein ZEAMMB73_Zm00001d019111 [Zea mays]ONM52245.1 hypothetical protein ZEAMMB73_Zm00001d019111 [Zea mays]